MNYVFLSGNLTADPELRYTGSGTAVCSFRIGVNDGREEATFIDIVAWEKLAEACAERLRKGDKVSLSGSIRVEKWEKEIDGAKETRTTWRVYANQVEFMTPSPSLTGPHQEELPRQPTEALPF